MFHVLPPPPVISFGFHCGDRTRARHLPEGLGAREALAPRRVRIETMLFWYMPNRRREEGPVQERRRLSGFWMTAILHTFSLLGRTRGLHVNCGKVAITPSPG